MRCILKSWVGPVLFVISVSVWGIPWMPHYQTWMPYGYDLGGIALVVLYCSVGFVSLGLHGLVMSVVYRKPASLQRGQVLSISVVTLGIGMGLVWFYNKLMAFTLMVPCCGNG